MSMKKPTSSFSEVIKSVYTPTAEDEKKVNRSASDADKRKEAAKLLGSKGGSIGGPARAAKLTAARRKEIASQGGKAAKRARGKEGN